LDKGEKINMAITFYPHEEDLGSSAIPAKLELLMRSAERYKSVVLESVVKTGETIPDPAKRMVPRDLTQSYNWQELAKLLRELHEMPEQNSASRLTKAGYLIKLAEIYEVLRSAKMPKLEAVRLALINEANQLKSASMV
jgi:hypothetical protein